MACFATIRRRIKSKMGDRIHFEGSVSCQPQTLTVLGDQREYECRRIHRSRKDPRCRGSTGQTRTVALQCGGTNRRRLAKVSEDLWPERLRRALSRLEQDSLEHHGREGAGAARLAGQN